MITELARPHFCSFKSNKLKLFKVCVLCGLRRTKKLIGDIIRIQPGDTLTEILETPASPVQVRLLPEHSGSDL